MKKDYQEYHGKIWKRVTSRVAQRAFNAGGEVLLLPVKVRFNNKWIPPFKISQSDSQTFMSVKEAYEESNCTHEMGTYCKYYIVSFDL